MRGASDCTPSSLSRVYLHVRPDCFMTMDYFLLLCSLLLPVVSAVEGKKSHLQLLLLLLRCLKLILPQYQVSQHPLPLRGWAPQRVRLPYTQILHYLSPPEFKPNVSFSKWPSGFFLGIPNGITGFTQPSAVAGSVVSTRLLCASTKAHPFQLLDVYSFFVRSAIAGCWCFRRRFQEISATLYLIGESRLLAPPLLPQTLSPRSAACILGLCECVAF